MSTTTDLATLKINYLTQVQYDTAVSSGTINENEIYMTPTGSLIDIFYPVGSYYETSDSTFNPNTAWGGTWIRETSGMVHISADDPNTIGEGTYHVSGATGASGAGTKDGGEPTVTLGTTEIPAHTHGSKTLTGTWTNNSARYPGTTSVSGIVSNKTLNTKEYWSHQTGSSAVTTSNGFQVTATHEHNSVGGGQAHNNMQPYIVVNRWHRTA